MILPALIHLDDAHLADAIIKPRPKPLPLFHLFSRCSVYTRRRLKCGLLACLIIMAVAAIFQTETTVGLWLKDAVYFLETGSLASAVAICLALIATA
jgi:hypothetical protein